MLSRQIRAFEAELPTVLFDRSRRATALTDAGARLLADAAPLLASAAALQRRVRQDPSTLTVGFMPGLTVTAAMRALTGQHPELTVDLVRTTWADQVAVLHDGISVIPLSASAYYRRADVVAVPVEDIGPNQVCVAWVTVSRTPWIAAFAAAIRSAR